MLHAPVADHGALSISGTQLIDSHGQPYRLRGVSTHGLQWFPQFANQAAFEWLRDNWGLNVVRAAMYLHSGGYLDNPHNKEVLYRTVDEAIAAGIYVIIDWHVLEDGNPMDHAWEASYFFREVATKYAGIPNVLYEICNEPNGEQVTWAAIRPYAEMIGAVIREHTPGIIIVGNPNWSQHPNDAAANPVSFNNAMYTLHFYAGTHFQDIRDNLIAAHKAGAAVFATEWSISSADEKSWKTNPSNASVWMQLINSLGISWTSWSLCDKDEPSSIVKPGTNPLGPFDATTVTQAGVWVRSQMTF